MAIFDRIKKFLLPETLAVEVKDLTTYRFMDYDIPVDLMMLTGGGPDTFDGISAAHIENLRKWIEIHPSYSIVEIGCGIGRDAIPLTRILSNGRYVGIDIIKRSIDWCNRNISARHNNFTFYHFDVEDKLHNSGGTTRTTEIIIPVPDGSVDRIIVFSVFTHMWQSDIEHYLKEFKRVLKPDGLVYATTFIYDEEILKSARLTNLTPFDLRFEHEVTQGCRINDADHPLGAVAYTREIWDQIVSRTGMRFAKPPLRGAWSGFYADPADGQDVAILSPDIPA